MQFQREPATVGLFEEALPLLEKHYKEISANLDIALDPDYPRYVALEAADCLRFFTARNEQNFLTGYAVFFVAPNIHYKSSKQAIQDVLFIDPDYRGVGGRLIKWCDVQLKEEGCQVVYHHVKAKHNFGALLERMGYVLVDLIYSKRLDGAAK